MLTMKVPFRKIKWILLMCLAVGVLTSCDPAKTVAKYKYLTDHKPATQPSDPVVATNPTETVKSSHVSKDLQTVIRKAESYLGTPYKYGGVNTAGIDCSALTMNAYLEIGISLQRSSAGQGGNGKLVKREDLKPGDIICFDAREGAGRIDHVGMVVEVKGTEVKFIHASVAGGVRYDQLNTGYWKDKYQEARRIVE
jgi:probable lipoprotein NlpC